MEEDEIGNKDRLEEARKRDAAKKTKNSEVSTVKSSSDLAKNVSNPFSGLSLLKQIDMFNDMPYFSALGAALIKDISDFIGIGSLPGIGTVITICCSIFIGMMMFLGGAGEKRKIAKGWIKKFLTLVGGTIVEILPGIDFLPVETMTAGLVYIWVLSDRKSSRE